MCCDRECQFCIDRNRECSENGARVGGCTEFRADLAIPEVADAEQNDDFRPVPGVRKARA